MNDQLRSNATIATIAIWIATTIISVFALMFEGWAVVIPLVVALIATLAIWIPPSEKSSHTDKGSANYSPEKRGDNSAYTMALLMEMMDEDEREEFKSQLKRRILSGEDITDESIIMDMEKRKRG
jgi:carbon starvation protein CstA